MDRIFEMEFGTMGKNLPKFKLDTMNIELTTNCPLRCPQCYCSLTGGKNIDINVAIKWIKEAANAGVKDVMLSGGETLCYPHIIDVVSAAKQYCGNVNIALSGYKFTQQMYEKLVQAGVTNIFISLNGSTKKINDLTRDGYNLALDALELLKKNGFKSTVINWVMHSNNASDFHNIMRLAEEYNVNTVSVIGFKPDSSKNLFTFPSKDQMIEIKDFIRSYRGRTKILIESCFSQLLALISETRLMGNLNVGKNKGCGAGITTFSVNVDGLLSPCRHLDYFESFDTLEEYLSCSKIINQIRVVEDIKREPCTSCHFKDYCRHCLAVNAKINNEIYIGNKFCPIYERQE